MCERRKREQPPELVGGHHAGSVRAGLRARGRDAGPTGRPARAQLGAVWMLHGHAAVGERHEGHEGETCSEQTARHTPEGRGCAGMSRREHVFATLLRSSDGRGPWPASSTPTAPEVQKSQFAGICWYECLQLTLHGRVVSGSARDSLAPHAVRPTARRQDGSAGQTQRPSGAPGEATGEGRSC